MSAKHRSRTFHRNARTIRAQVARLWDLGEPVACWRCGRPIHPGQPWDVGHINDSATSDLEDLAPEHRHGTTTCIGNRRAGGRLGAAVTNGRRVERRPGGTASTWNM